MKYKPFETREDNYLFDIIRAKNKPIMSIRDCCLLSGLSCSTIRRAIADGSLPSFQIRNRAKIQIRKEDFERWAGIEPKEYLGGRL